MLQRAPVVQAVAAAFNASSESFKLLLRDDAALTRLKTAGEPFCQLRCTQCVHTLLASGALQGFPSFTDCLQ